MRAPTGAVGRLRTGLRRLFYGHRPAAQVFQAGLLALAAVCGQVLNIPDDEG